MNSTAIYPPTCGTRPFRICEHGFRKVLQDQRGQKANCDGVIRRQLRPVFIQAVLRRAFFLNPIAPLCRSFVIRTNNARLDAHSPLRESSARTDDFLLRTREIQCREKLQFIAEYSRGSLARQLRLGEDLMEHAPKVIVQESKGFALNNMQVHC